MRTVTIEPVTKTKFRIYLDGQFAFILYKSELSGCRLQDGEEVTEEQVEEILSTMVLKRAKQKVLSLLQSMDRTEQELRSRLLSQEFPEPIVEQAIGYAASYGYINDRRYIEHFILSRKGRKSKKEIYAELGRKQLDGDMISEVMEQCYEEDDSSEAIRHFLKKKKYDPDHASMADKQKLFAYLARKGFSYREIKTAMELESDE